jgi:serine/threonine-protein kinase
VTLAGQTLARRYDLLQELGAGGFGSVYRAYDRELDELVALKVIHPDLVAQPAMLERFRQEVKLARRVTHVNIARTFELTSADGVVFCTMELVDGESLRQRLVRQGRLPVSEAIAIAAELCDGLGAAHAAGVVHRDIKPDNVLIAADGRVVLADFGVASAAADASGGEVSGTPAYMAPEQARGEPATPAADVYAVGVILHEMVTGATAFEGSATTILDAKQRVEWLTADGAAVPSELADLIARATARDRSERIASAFELRRLLELPARGRLVAPASATVHAPELATVVVLAPRATSGDAPLHLADGVHDQLLRRLMRRPRLRVLPRASGSEPGAIVAGLRVGTTLTLTIEAPGAAAQQLELPLSIDAVPLAAEIAAAAIASASDPAATPAGEAEELVLRARQLARGSFAGVAAGFELLERAIALRPADPAIIASHALGYTRYTVLAGDENLGRVARTAEIVRHALTVAPEAAEPHVAAALLELSTGEAARAALHFRRAIACSPYLAEAHEGLGRLLLEAGFHDRALARIEEALAMAPYLHTVRWELVRAHALAGRWAEHDRLIAELAREADRPMVHFRHASWRRDAKVIAALAPAVAAIQRGFDPTMLAHLVSVYLGNPWPAHRDWLVDFVHGPELLRRRRAFRIQLIAEAAGFAGDGETCLALIDYASQHGLYDLSWLDQCPLLGPARALAGYADVHAQVKRRAEAILDALYGDHEPAALTDTVVL